MVECNSIESIEHSSVDTSNLIDQQFRLNKISEIEDYFIAETKERELMSKKLIVLSVTSASISIASFATVIGIPVGITSASLSLAFSLCTGLVKKPLKATRYKKRNIIKLLC